MTKLRSLRSIDLTRMECKYRSAGRGWGFDRGIDLTRMECKYNNQKSKSEKTNSIDLTRMECKFASGNVGTSVCVV